MAPLALALEIDGAGAHPGGVAPGGDATRPAPRPAAPAPPRRGRRARRLHAGDARRRPRCRRPRRRRPVASGRSSGPPSSPRSPASSASCRSCRPPTPSRSTSRRRSPRSTTSATAAPGGSSPARPTPLPHGPGNVLPSPMPTGCAARPPTACTSRARCGTRGRTTPSIRDVATSRYLDRDRIHYIDFEGSTYSVKGPATVPRPPQGHVVVFAAPDLVDPASVDVALVSGPRRRRRRRRGRGGGAAPRRFAEVEVALDTPGLSGAERVADLERAAPWPDAGRLRYVGAADGLVRLLAELAALRRRRAAAPARHRRGPRRAVQARRPAAVRRRASSARPIPGHTLRATLGLERPANQFAAAAAVTGG